MRTEFPRVEWRDIKFRPTGLDDQEVLTSGRYWYRARVLTGRNERSPRFQNRFGVLSPGRLRILGRFGAGGVVPFRSG